MKKVMQRHWIKIWWSVSVGLSFCLGCLMKLLIKEPPFTDWAYIFGMAITMPSLLISAFLYKLRQNR